VGGGWWWQAARFPKPFPSIISFHFLQLGSRFRELPGTEEIFDALFWLPQQLVTVVVAAAQRRSEHRLCCTLGPGGKACGEG